MKLTLGKKIFSGFGLRLAVLVVMSLLAYSGASKILKNAKTILEVKDIVLRPYRQDIFHASTV